VAAVSMSLIWKKRVTRMSEQSGLRFGESDSSNFESKNCSVFTSLQSNGSLSNA